MVRVFEERAEEMGRRSMVKDAFRLAEELGASLKTELRKCQVERASSQRHIPI